MKQRIFIFLFVMVGFTLKAYTDSPGEERIQSIEDRVAESENHSDSEDDYEYDSNDDYDKDDNNYDERHSGSDGATLTKFFILMFRYSAHFNFSKYPYSPEESFAFNSLVDRREDDKRIAYLNMNLDSAAYGYSTFSHNLIIRANLGAFHFHGMNRLTYSGDEIFGVYNYGLGLTVSIPGFLWDFYFGPFYTDALPHAIMSAGTSLSIFFPGNISVEANGFISDYNGLPFSEISGHVRYSANRFHVGVGVSYCDYADIKFLGPSVSLGVWF